jgi:hypothetical protein
VSRQAPEGFRPHPNTKRDAANDGQQRRHVGGKQTETRRKGDPVVRAPACGQPLTDNQEAHDEQDDADDARDQIDGARLAD